MLIVLEVASGPPWRAGIWALAPTLTVPIGSATSGVGGFVVDAAIKAGRAATQLAVCYSNYTACATCRCRS